MIISSVCSQRRSEGDAEDSRVSTFFCECGSPVSDEQLQIRGIGSRLEAKLQFSVD
jgi:hypothetical protein